MPSPRTGTGAATAGGATGAATGTVVGAFTGDGAATAGGATGDETGTVLGSFGGEAAATAGGASVVSQGKASNNLLTDPWNVVERMLAYTADILLGDLGVDYWSVIPLFPNLNDVITVDSGASTIVVEATTSSLADIAAGRATWSALYTDSGEQTVPNTKTGIRIKHVQLDGNVAISLSASLHRTDRTAS